MNVLFSSYLKIAMYVSTWPCLQSLATVHSYIINAQFYVCCIYKYTYTIPVTDMADRAGLGVAVCNHMLSCAAWCIVAMPSDLVIWCN